MNASSTVSDDTLSSAPNPDLIDGVAPLDAPIFDLFFDTCRRANPERSLRDARLLSELADYWTTHLLPVGFPEGVLPVPSTKLLWDWVLAYGSLADRKRVTHTDHTREQVWADQTTSNRLEVGSDPLVGLLEWRCNHLIDGAKQQSFTWLDTDDLVALGLPDVVGTPAGRWFLAQSQRGFTTNFMGFLDTQFNRKAHDLLRWPPTALSSFDRLLLSLINDADANPHNGLSPSARAWEATCLLDPGGVSR